MDCWVQTNEDMNPVRVEDLTSAEVNGIVKLLQVLAAEGELVFIRDAIEEEDIYENYDAWSAAKKQRNIESSRKIKANCVNASYPDYHNDPFNVIKLDKAAYVDKWSKEYDGKPKSSWESIFDAVEDEFELYADDEASSDSTGRTLIEQYEDGAIDEYEMSSEFDRWVDWLDFNDYDYED